MHFNLMVLCDDHLSKCQKKAADIIKTTVKVEEKLNELNSDWEPCMKEEIRSTEVFMASCGLVHDDIRNADILEIAEIALIEPTYEGLLATWKDMLKACEHIENEYVEKISTTAENKNIIERRLYDLSPDIYRSIHMLSEIGILKELATEVVIAEKEKSVRSQGKDDGEWEYLHDKIIRSEQLSCLYNNP